MGGVLIKVVDGRPFVSVDGSPFVPLLGAGKAMKAWEKQGVEGGTKDGIYNVVNVAPEGAPEQWRLKKDLTEEPAS